MTRTLVPSSAHPLATVAARHCLWSSHTPASRVGSVACIVCWWKAMSDDTAFADTEELGEHPAVDVDYIDEIAVEEALVGRRRVRLTMAEWAVAIRRLRGEDRWISQAEIIERLSLVDLPEPAAAPVVAPLVRGLAVAA